MSVLSLSSARSLGGILGSLVYHVFGFRRTIVHENLQHAFPGLPAQEREAIARNSYRSIGITLIELLRLHRMSEDELRKTVRIEGLDVLRKCVSRGKGVVVLSAHIGNWELITISFKVLAGISVEALYKPQSNPWIDKAVLKRRTRFGAALIPMGMSVREILRILQEGRCILIAADQSAPMESIRVPFFGREVPVFQGPAVFCLKTGAALVAVHALREKTGTYVISCREIPFSDLAYDDQSVLELTRRHVRITEETIRQSPGQWMWMHRRWKHTQVAS